jgi:hypothetical protein
MAYWLLFIIYEWLILNMLSGRSLLSFQHFLKRVDDVTEEAVTFQFLKRVGITGEA